VYSVVRTEERGDEEDRGQVLKRKRKASISCTV
jgi:hypothetical protein